MSQPSPLLSIKDLVVNFKRGRRTVHAVSGVSVDVMPGETLGVVGESGCGKTSLGRAVVQIQAVSAGSVHFEGVDLSSLSGATLRRARTGIQMIFQDPVSSLNPRRPVRDLVAEPLDIWKTERGEARLRKVRQMLHDVGLDPDLCEARFPHQLSGGQCQRVSIARALVMRPKLLVCDEIVSSLDVSVQAQILNLLEDLKAHYGLTIIFIAHDLAVIKNVSDRVAVMYLGRLCELASSDQLYASPTHPYTRALLAAASSFDPRPPGHPSVISGEPASAFDPPSGCRFRTRCPYAQDRCATERPELRELAPGHHVACHFPLTRSAS
jgi:peptide/nickel transport system ATP-binding protein